MVLRFKGPDKVFLGVEAIAEGDGRYALVSAHDLFGNFGNPALSDVIGRGQPNRVPKYAQKVVERIAAHPGTILQRDFALQIFLDVIDHPLNVFPVVHSALHVDSCNTTNCSAACEQIRAVGGFRFAIRSSLCHYITFYTRMVDKNCGIILFGKFIFLYGNVKSDTIPVRNWLVIILQGGMEKWEG